MDRHPTTAMGTEPLFESAFDHLDVSEDHKRAGALKGMLGSLLDSINRTPGIPADSPLAISARMARVLLRKV